MTIQINITKLDIAYPSNMLTTSDT